VRSLIVRSLILVVGVLLLALTPYGEPLAQLSTSPPMGCTEPSGGTCVIGGCEECDGPECSWSINGDSGGLVATVESGLYCTDEYCPTSECDNPELLSASGKVTMTRTSGNNGWDADVVVCEAIALCSNPGLGCGRCRVVELSGGSSDSYTTTDLECEVEWAGDWQYHIWAMVVDLSVCTDECAEEDENICSPLSDCNDCLLQGYAHAASCCGEVPE
jgi:hypothetical protein